MSISRLMQMGAAGAGGGATGSYLAVAHKNAFSSFFTLLDHTTPGSLSVADRLPNVTAGGAFGDVSFSPDGNYIAFAHSGTVGFTLLDHNTPGTIVVADTFSAEDGNSCAFSPNSDYIAVGAESNKLILLNHTTAGSVSLATQITISRDDIRSCAFSPDGNYIAVTSDDGGGIGNPLFTLLDHTTPGSLSVAATYTPTGGTCPDVEFSPDGNYIAVGSGFNPQITILDHNTPGSISVADTFGLPGTCNALSFSSDGNYIAAGHDAGSYFSLLNFNSSTGSVSLASNSVTTGPATISTDFTLDTKYIAAGASSTTPWLTLIDHTTPGSISVATTFDIGARTSGVKFSPF